LNENIKLIITKFFRRNAFWCLRLVSPRFTSKKTQKKALLTGILLAFFVTAMLLHTDFSSFNLYEEAYDTSENLQSPDLHNRATYVTDSEENWIINGTFEDTPDPWNNETYDTGSYSNFMTTYWTGDPTHQNETGLGESNILLRIDGYWWINKYYYDQGDKAWWNQTVMVDRQTQIPETAESAKIEFKYYVMAADNETKLRDRIMLKFWINDSVVWERSLKELTGPGSGWTYVKITSVEEAGGILLSKWLNQLLPTYLEFKVELVVITAGNSAEDLSNTTQIYVDNIDLIIKSEDTNYNLPIEVTSKYGDQANFSVYYTYFDSSENKLKLVENAQIEITYNGTPWMGGCTVEKHTDPVLSSYMVTLQTPQTIELGTYYPIWINASSPGFERQRFPIKVNVVSVPTILNADTISLTKEIGKTAMFQVMFSDDQGSGIMGANLTYEWDHGSGQLVEEGDGVYSLTIDTSSLNKGTYYINITAYLENYESQLLRLSLVILPLETDFMDQILDYLPYLILLVIGAFASVVIAQTYFVRKQERLDRKNIRRIMVIWESFALYDQIPSETIAEGSGMDKDLVSGFFTAIKDITAEVAGTILETMKVYPAHPYYFVYTGKFYCVLILSDKPSPRLEEKLLLFAENVKEKYAELYLSDLLGVLEVKLDLDEEVMRIFGITPSTALQDMVTVSLSYEEIDRLKVKDDVKAVLIAGRVLADQKKEFPLGELIQVATAELSGDTRTTHEAVIEAIRRDLLIVTKKAIQKEEK